MNSLYIYFGVKPTKVNEQFLWILILAAKVKDLICHIKVFKNKTFDY